MAANFVRASSQRLVNAAPQTFVAPFTVGVYTRTVTSAVNAAVWSLVNPAISTEYFELRQASIGSWQLFIRTPTDALAIVAGLSLTTWTFIIVRVISATNKWITTLSGLGGGASSGLISHAQLISNIAPANLTKLSLGSLEHSAPTDFLDGQIAEFWYTNTDVQPDGAQLKDALLWRLAYNGPFSVPHVRDAIVEYRSMRDFPDSRGDKKGEVYFGKNGYQNWSNTNGVTTTFHPPLSYEMPFSLRRGMINPELLAPLTTPAVVMRQYITSVQVV